MYKFGEIYFANLPVQPDSRVQQGYRPVLVVSNDKNNYYSTVVSVVPLTSSRTKRHLPTHINRHELSYSALGRLRQVQFYRLDSLSSCKPSR
ncbi:MAG: type II toxin-antitoxin system PemK/MazF family toxin [Ruminiclostridium sp.]|nr:type II toxin-antitoxin system PemK/MazF family toxin [Ruminiclostridium sp.]